MPVYFARAGSLVKIGHAIDIPKRIETLQTGQAMPLDVVREVPGGRAVEAAFHRLWSDRRVRGEWFRWDDAMLTATVEAVTAKPFAPAPRPHIDALDLLAAHLGGDSRVAATLKVSPQVLNNWRRRGISATQRPAVWMLVNDHGGGLSRDWMFVASP